MHNKNNHHYPSIHQIDYVNPSLTLLIYTTPILVSIQDKSLQILCHEIWNGPYANKIALLDVLESHKPPSIPLSHIKGSKNKSIHEQSTLNL